MFREAPMGSVIGGDCRERELVTVLAVSLLSFPQLSVFSPSTKSMLFFKVF